MFWHVERVVKCSGKNSIADYEFLKSAVKSSGKKGAESKFLIKKYNNKM